MGGGEPNISLYNYVPSNCGGRSLRTLQMKAAIKETMDEMVDRYFKARDRYHLIQPFPKESLRIAEPTRDIHYICYFR